MGSTRLPGKIIKKVCGSTLLEHEILRVKKSKLIDQVVIATTNKSQDDIVEELVKKIGVKIFRGSENDVLDRYYQAAKKFKATCVVRLTGDCPLIDPEVIDKVVKYYLDNKTIFDYVSNVRPATYPDGMDTEIFTFQVLEKSWRQAKLASEREHVTAYIAKNNGIFRVGNVESNNDYSEIRLTIDEPQDWQLIEKIFIKLYPEKQDFNLNDILNLLKNNPSYVEINKNIIRNEGYIKSLAKDNY